MIRLVRILPDRTLDRILAAALRPTFPSNEMNTTTPLSLVLKSAHQ
jgi:hypothetical protein